MSATFWIIIAGAAATYLTRVGGHLLISRFDSVHPRVEARLNAVPAAGRPPPVPPGLVWVHQWPDGPATAENAAVVAAVAQLPGRANS